MIITYHGDNYFKLQEGDETILSDPTDQRSFKGAKIAVNTLNPSRIDEVSDTDEIFIINHGGEYEVEGIRIYGWSSGFGDYDKKEREKTIYRVDFKDFRFAFFGFLSEEPNAEIISELEDVDIAFIPVGSDDFIAPDKAAKFIRQIEPSLIIPANFGEIDPFLKEMNQKERKPEERIVLKKTDLKGGEMTVRCLKE